MWLSTKRKRNEESMSSSTPAKTREAASTTTASDDTLRAGDDWQSTLPLDWTRMHRSIGHRGRKRPLSKETRTIQRNYNDDDDTTSNNFEGRAIFCLHDDDPSWVQGYFIPTGSTKPWGMLAIQEEVDDCLACCSGGFRRLSLTVYHHNTTRIDSIRTRNESTGKKNSFKIDGIDWTGGDMIALYHPRYVDMNTERLLTVSIIMTSRRVLLPA
jgi:hypothetical protein